MRVAWCDMLAGHGEAWGAWCGMGKGGMAWSIERIEWEYQNCTSILLNA